MANKFSSAAKEITGGSQVIAGLEKINNDLLIAAYPNGITINGADLITSADGDTGEEKQFCVFTFAEDPTKYGKYTCSLWRCSVYRQQNYRRLT